MNYEEFSKRMGPYNPNQSHRSRMTKQGIILAKERKANVQKKLDEDIAKANKKQAVKKVLEKHGEKKLTIKEQNQKHWADLAKHENTLPTGHGLK